MSNIYELMANRRSTRKYKTDQIGDEIVDRVTDAGLLAPSGADRLPYNYICIKDSSLKQQIRSACETADETWHDNMDEKTKKWIAAKEITTDKPFLTEAPVLIVISGDTRQHYWLESTWISISYAVLAAQNEGLGTVTYTPTEPSFLNEILGLPEHFAPQVILPLGYPNEEIGKKNPRPKGKVFWNKYEK